MGVRHILSATSFLILMVLATGVLAQEKGLSEETTPPVIDPAIKNPYGQYCKLLTGLAASYSEPYTYEIKDDGSLFATIDNQPTKIGFRVVCDQWGPVQFGETFGVASYNRAFSIDELRACNKQDGGTYLDDTKKEKCGCITAGSVTVSIPNYGGSYDPVDQGVATNIRRSNVTWGVGGPTTAQIFPDDANEEKKIPLTSTVPQLYNEYVALTAPVFTPGATTFEPGRTTIPYKNLVPESTKQTKNAQTCFVVHYEYDMIKEGDLNQDYCRIKGGKWIDEAPLGHQCCGDDGGYGKDFLYAVPGTDGQAKALCVNGTNIRTGEKGWQVMMNTSDKKGEIVRLSLQANPDDSVAPFVPTENVDVLFTDEGARVCGLLPVETLSSINMLARNKVTRITTSAGIGDKTEIHEFACGYYPPTPDTRRGSYALECVGSDPCSFNADASCQATRGFTNFTAGDSASLPANGASILGSPTTDQYFCGSNRAGAAARWIGSLDVDQASCEAANSEQGGPDPDFVWTGSRCCGDTNDEYYNDQGIMVLSSMLPKPVAAKENKLNLTVGQTFGHALGCWNSLPVFGTGVQKRFVSDVDPSTTNINSFIPDALGISSAELPARSIINYNGSFHGCNLSAVQGPEGDLGYHDQHWCYQNSTCHPTDPNLLIQVDSLCAVSPLRCVAACVKDGAGEGWAECAAIAPVCTNVTQRAQIWYPNASVPFSAPAPQGNPCSRSDECPAGYVCYGGASKFCTQATYGQTCKAEKTDCKDVTTFCPGGPEQPPLQPNERTVKYKGQMGKVNSKLCTGVLLGEYKTVQDLAESAEFKAITPSFVWPAFQEDISSDKKIAARQKKINSKCYIKKDKSRPNYAKATDPVCYPRNQTLFDPPKKSKDGTKSVPLSSSLRFDKCHAWLTGGLLYKTKDMVKKFEPTRLDNDFYDKLKAENLCECGNARILTSDEDKESKTNAKKKPKKPLQFIIECRTRKDPAKDCAGVPI